MQHESTKSLDHTNSRPISNTPILARIEMCYYTDLQREVLCKEFTFARITFSARRQAKDKPSDRRADSEQKVERPQISPTSTSPRPEVHDDRRPELSIEKVGGKSDPLKLSKKGRTSYEGPVKKGHDKKINILQS